MSFEFFREAQSSFLHASELEPILRETFLKDLKEKAPELAAEVLLLLSYVEGADRYFQDLEQGTGITELRDLTLSLASSFFPQENQINIPETIGPYQILSLLGNGGMGVVYKAAQVEGSDFFREVALKVIHPRYQDLFQRHLEMERNALAKMNHDNVARFFNHGTTDEGQAYLVMEFVSGERIHDYCETHQLSLKERIGLMIQVCHGAAHAHAKNLLHGDIKPDNILVSHQERPVVKMIDFGLSRKLFQSLDESFPLMGSPIFMSPEAVDGVERLDTRSDIYSLGTVLYQLLTGVPVLEIGDFDGLSAEERLLLVKTRKRKKPSERILAEPGRLKQLRECFGPSWRGLMKSLVSDLDGITVKAMELNPNDRYQRVTEFQNDLARFLASEPVSTANHTLSYISIRWCKRHQLRSAGLLAGLLIVLVSWTALYKTAQANGKVRASLSQLTQTNSFYEQMFKSAHPLKNGYEMSFLEVIKTWTSSIDSFAKNNSQLELDLRVNMVETLQSLDEHELARGEFEKILPLVELLRGKDSKAYADNLRHYAMTLIELEMTDPAEKAIQEGLTIYMQHANTNSDDLLLMEGTHATFLLRLGNRKEAEILAHRVFDSLSGMHEVSFSCRVEVSQILANVWIEAGQASKAESLLRNIYDLQKQRLGPYHPSTATTSINLATLFERQARYEMAEALYREVWQNMKPRLGPNHHYIFTARHGVGYALWGQGKAQEAQVILESLISDQSGWLGSQHSSVLASKHTLAQLLSAEHKTEEALSLLGELVVSYQGLGRAQSLPALKAQNNLGNTLLKLGRVDEALIVLEKVYAIKLEVFGTQAETTLNSSVTLAEAQIKAGRPQQALNSIQQVLELVEGKPDLILSKARYRIYLGECLIHLKRYEEAELALKESERLLEGHRWQSEARLKLQLLYSLWHADPSSK